ncbi:hypothetical protein DFR70_11636 [Nocardia tenerifensis]|uniref:DUF8176 domain-containing protein n=1 Tax=Nocardia tenerifensis TaxID=228006 RepID=A0A318JVD5_9NOCA|nr:hypothetical protein [Nocardia tenerifensis]PXX57806.1 hypothetical protein DFR70_11636 [Nocardia tenerifensis]
MLKSYKELSRWYAALEPATAPVPQGAPDAMPEDEDGPARYPHYIRDDPEIPADLPAQRSEFTGGWSDWVGRAPGPDDDYVPREADLVRFPWPDDDDDDDYDPLDEPRPRLSNPLRLEARARGSRRARVFVVLVIAVLLLGAAAAGALFLLHTSTSRAATPRLPASSASVQFTAGSVQAGVSTDSLRGKAQAGVTTHRPSGACPTERTASIVRAAEMGGTTTGPDAILAFQYAYYVERSGERVRQFVAPDAAVSPASTIQRGIDTIPAGTTHCVRIVTLADNQYSVEVTEYRPGGVPATYNKQTVTTAVIDGRTLITGIAAG